MQKKSTQQNEHLQNDVFGSSLIVINAIAHTESS